MSLISTDSAHINQLIDAAINFIQTTLAKAKKSKIVIGVSGGIDSAVALSLAVKALGPQNVIPILMPYGEQNMADAQTLVDWLGLSPAQTLTLPVTTMTQAAAAMLELPIIGELNATDQLRLGNLMVRSRMMILFDQAKKLDALVCGTENKSEHFLGYFTRFGDEASDLEPITDWWKTEVKAAAQTMNLPEIIIQKAPSAGLWQGQTDESELGFSYTEADEIMAAWIEWSAKTTATNLGEAEVGEIATLASQPTELVHQVLAKVTQTQFKRETPYLNA